MRIARSITPPSSTAQSLFELLKKPTGLGKGTITLQCPAANTANILFGDSSFQPGFVAPGALLTLEHTDLKDVYVTGNNVNLLTVIQVQ